jgi:hypothetical protein
VPVHVTDRDIQVNVCIGTEGLPPTPTPCPIQTPCILGERPRPCADPCGLGCGCESCPPCAPGEVLAPHANACECVDPNASPTPTPTPNPCHFSTPPLCPTGHRIDCAPDVCPEDCRCEPCAPCPDGLVYSEVDQCACVDPTQFTPTPTATPTPTGPTPTVCPEKSRCPDSQRPRPCSDPCGLHCGCEPDPGNTDTPTPAVVVTGTPCPVQTQPQCGPDQTLDCDVGIDQCRPCQCAPCAPCGPGFQRGDRPCECVAIAAQPPADRDNEASVGSSGSCAIAAPSGSDGVSWGLMLGALILWRGSRFGGRHAGG